MEHLNGETFVITGGNSGIGYEAASHLAQHGASVIIACRNEHKAKAAVQAILHRTPKANISYTCLDLADLNSVRTCAATLSHKLDHLDVLINNAGVMALPRTLTGDGFEMQLGTNHLGHFALTAQLYPLLRRAPHPRIITVASNAHKLGRIRFDDLHGTTNYSSWGAYAQSKLANLLFFHELHRRLTQREPKVRSVACHPGYADTKLPFNSSTLTSSWAARLLFHIGGRYIAQSAQMGSWPTLFAATQDLPSGSYVGPAGWFEMAGEPTLVQTSKRAREVETARRLWEVSESATGIQFLGHDD